MADNPFLLAADKPLELLSLLRSTPDIASAQDEHGYSLLHAAASYNHLDLLRALVLDFHVDVNLKDEDGETALFVVETTECAKVLVEECHADTTVRGEDERTARERIETEGDFPEVALYLLELEKSPAGEALIEGADSIVHHPPPVPEGLSIDVGTMSPEDARNEVVDAEFKRRIDALAARADFNAPEGQEELRELVAEALRGQLSDTRDIRHRTG